MTHASRLTFLCRAQRIALDDRSRENNNYSQNEAADVYIDDVAQGRVWAERTYTAKHRSEAALRPILPPRQRRRFTTGRLQRGPEARL